MTTGLRRTLLIILCRDEYVRNYLTTDALEDLERDFECHYLASDQIVLRDQLERRPGFRGYYTFDKRVEATHYNIFTVLMWRYRALSSSFRFRMMRQWDAKLGRPRGIAAGSRAAADYALRRVRAWKERLQLGILGSDAVFPTYKRRVIDRLPVNEKIRETIASLRPDLVVFPSSAYDAAGTDVARVARAEGIPSLFLVDNWDNLSSKSLMWEKPDHVGVWGEQCVEHAVSIQGMRRDQATALGTPRFDQYFRLREEPLASHFDFPYSLFVGTALAFNEADALERLDTAIAANEPLLGGLKVVYRPHPWRQGKDTIIGRNLRHVIVDPQLAEWYASDQSGRRLQPELAYYPRLLQNAEFMIGGLTSMIIESQIFWKRFLALVYEDKRNLTSQHNALRYYEHFRGLENLSGLDLCHDFDTLGDRFIECWHRRLQVVRSRVDREREYFVHDNGEPYKRRLRALVEQTIGAYDQTMPLAPARAG